jgi:MFS family permease
MMPLGPQFTHPVWHQRCPVRPAGFGLHAGGRCIRAAGLDLHRPLWPQAPAADPVRLVCMATLACGLAPTYAALMVARIAAGVFGGVLSALCQTIVGDVIPFERRGRAMGIVMTSFSVSTVAGVPCGLFLAAHWAGMRRSLASLRCRAIAGCLCGAAPCRAGCAPAARPTVGLRGIPRCWPIPTTRRRLCSRRCSCLPVSR